MIKYVIIIYVELETEGDFSENAPWLGPPEVGVTSDVNSLMQPIERKMK